MNTIYKYPLPCRDAVLVPMPQHARILSVHVQRGVPCMWAPVDTDAPVVARRIAIVGTGHPLPEEILAGSFVGAFILHDGALVFHVFDCGDRGQE